MQETPHSQNKLKIKFGPNDDDAEEVDNVLIKFREGPVFNCREHYESKGYKNVTMLKSCNELYIIGTGTADKDGETYIPMYNVLQVAVDYLDKKPTGYPE